MTGFIYLIITLVVLLSFIGLNVLFLVYMERKVAGHMQRRYGPMEVGPHGILQIIADGLKLISKQLLVPDAADKPLFWLAPLIVFAPVAVILIVIPFSEHLLIRNVNLGLLLILAFSSFNVLGILLAGWSQNNKYSLIGAARAVAQNIAYEIPLCLALLAVVFKAGSLNLLEIVKIQGYYPWQWYVVTQPLAFIICIIAGVAETNRTPFDLPEAESELTAGFHTEYSGIGFGLFFLTEYTNVFIVCAVATTLFLGGWKGPLLPGVIWFFIKVYLLVFVMMWFRWTYPRVRFDQLLSFSWKYLIPLSLINLILTGILMKL